MDHSSPSDRGERLPADAASIDFESDERFRFGTYPGTGAAILDIETNRVYPFGREDAARNALGEMKAAPESHGYFPIRYVVGYLFNETEATS